jgi:uncharacterized protein with HEPN domain
MDDEKPGMQSSATQVIGDAAKNLPEDLTGTIPEIDWSGISGMRDIITHRYFRVDWHLIWKSIQEELPAFGAQIPKLRSEFPD